MPIYGGTEKIDTTGYAVIRGEARYAKRSVTRYHYDEGKVSHGETATGFNPASCLDGQALAGTGALVFEGELLDPSRH